MTPEQTLYLLMVESGMKIYPGTMDSIREAIRDGNIYFFEENNIPSGFVTWYWEGKALVINNLVKWNGKGKFNLFSLRKILHGKYPSLKKVKWHDDRRGRNCEYVFI